MGFCKMGFRDLFFQLISPVFRTHHLVKPKFHDKIWGLERWVNWKTHLSHLPESILCHEILVFLKDEFKRWLEKWETWVGKIDP